MSENMRYDLVIYFEIYEISIVFSVEGVIATVHREVDLLVSTDVC